MTLAIRKGFAKPALSKFNSETRRLQWVVWESSTLLLDYPQTVGLQELNY
ncbi:hypothetical protein RP20_CCG017220 [Aedes albopictus]|nr:hypothetical protein RP20_CCG017220 [Aedes albopictus]